MMTPNKTLEPTPVAASLDALSQESGVAQLGRYAKRHACSATVGSSATLVFGQRWPQPKRTPDFVCSASRPSVGREEFGLTSQSRATVERFFRPALLGLLGARKESHNKTLDSTAVSVSVLMFADSIAFFSYLARAHPAVGQLFR
jgi:hypothetical protein